MLLVLFLFMLCCAVKCDYVSNNYYIIEMPEPEVARDYNTPFKVYWNVPTKQCRSRNVIFDNLEKFGIIQNQDDNFEGERITIMYDPGVFPAIFKADSGKYRYRNGGVPQQGNLELHLTAFRESLNKSIPNPDFSGIGVIDFESWRPIFRQQFGSLKPYIDLSMNIEKRRHWWWPASWQKMEATKRFEDAARLFMQTTLSIAKQMRPRAMWGYYAYPYCYNMAGTRMAESCSSDVKRENDKIYWQWAESTALYPSVYSSVNLSTSQLAALVRGRVTEANRVKKAGTLVLPYFWFRYRDAGFMTEEDVTAVFDALMKTNASGLIIWGSSNDVNELNKCNELYKYVETKLGPIIKKYIQQINRNYDSTLHDDAENGDEYNDAFINTTAATITVKPTTVEPTSVELTSVQQTIDQLTTNQPTTDQQTTDQPTTVQTTLNEIDSTTSHSYKIGFHLNFTLLPKNIYDKIASDIKEIQLNDSYNKTDDDKIDPETLEESSFWDMLKKQLYFDTENNKQSTRSIQNEENPDDLENNNAGSYFKRAAILDVTSTQKNIDNLFSQTVMPEDHLTRILGANSDKFLASLEKHTNPVSLTSADGTANDNLDPFLVNLTPPVIESGNTNYYKSVEDTFLQSTTEKLENFVIIRDNENEDSAMSEISKSVIETFPETSTDISENFVIISDKENKDTGSWFSSERLNSEQYERNVNET